MSEEYNLVEMGLVAGTGVLVAFFPDLEAPLTENLHKVGKREFTLFSHDGITLDLFPLTDSLDVKWWMVKMAAKEQGLDIIQPFFHGPAEEFRVNIIPPNRKPGTVLAVRQWHRGPWLTLEKRKEEEQTNDE